MHNKSIVYYTGDTRFEWSPESLDTGLGGANARIIYLTREWKKMGYAVTVYTNCGKKEGIYDGVNWVNCDKFNSKVCFDILIMWQYAWRLHKSIIKHEVQANNLWLDLGSMLLPEESTLENIGFYDKIFCKTNFHRSTLSEIPDEKIAVIPNGIDPKYEDLANNVKDNYALIYASNYIRGLNSMLKFGWPIIKKEIPQTKLHIYYGGIKKDSPTHRLTKTYRLIKQQKDVYEHGKIGKDALMKIKSTSSINYYGCTFKETDCNTVRESAYVGCVPVTTNYAGLQDKDYCVKVDGNPWLRETQEKLAYRIIELVKNPIELNKIRKKFLNIVQNETWDNVAKKWIEEAN